MTDESGVRLPPSAFRLITALAIAVAGVVAYSTSFQNEFVWDDASSIQVNKHVKDPSQFFQLFREDQHPFGRGQGNFYRPLVAASFMLDFALSHKPPGPGVEEPVVPDVSPFLFHISNTLWHIAAALLLFALLSRLGAPRFVQAVVPIIYVLHPLHTEAIAYISGRADPMSAVFMYAALWFAMWDRTAGRRAAGAALSALCFCAALMSKEAAFIYPVLLLLFVMVRPVEGNGGLRAFLPRLIPLCLAIILMAIYAYLRMTVLHFGSNPTPDTSLGQRLTELCQAFAWYLRLLFVPTGLHMERTLAGASGWTAALGAGLLAAMLVLLVENLWHGKRRAALGWGWFLIAWFPISGIFPLNAPMAEHWMYVPMAGFFWALAETVYSVCKGRRGATRIAAAAAYGLCAFFLALTAARNPVWHDNERLFRSTLAANPNSVRVHYNLAVTYGDIEGNLPGARRHYETVLALYEKQKRAARDGTQAEEMFWDEELESHLSLGRIYLGKQDYLQAAEHYAAVLRIKPDEQHKPMMAAAALGMGQCYLAVGDIQHAGAFFKQAVAYAPELQHQVQQALADSG